MGTFILLGILVFVIVQVFVLLFIVNRLVEAYKQRGVDKEYDTQQQEFNKQANLSKKSVNTVKTTLKNSEHPIVAVPINGE